MTLNEYELLCILVSIRNSQANTVVERVHPTIGNIILTFKNQQMDLDNENPSEGTLSSAMFAILCMVHTSMQHTTSLLVFGMDETLTINQKPTNN